MKNLKNTLAAATLMAVLGMGTVSANAGLLISDRTANTTKTECTVKGGGFLQEITGIILLGLSGLLISDAPTPQCAETDGLLISDRSGLLISD